MKLRRVIKMFGGFAAVILVILILGALFLPRLIDSQLTKGTDWGQAFNSCES